MNVWARFRTFGRRRRATILIMVVSLLALLFVIITGFLSVARQSRQTFTRFQQGVTADQVVEDVGGSVVNLATDQLRGDNGGVLDGPQADFANIPGVGGSAWLSSAEPLWSWGDTDILFDGSVTDATVRRLGQMVWAALSSFGAGGSAPVQGSLASLISESSTDSDTLWSMADLERYARSPWLDADGDGIPDTSLASVAVLSALANEMAGTPLPIPDGPWFTPSAIPPFSGGANADGDRLLAVWNRIEQQARYIVAARVVGHGGMATLDSPTPYNASGNVAYEPFNRRYTVWQFDALRNPLDRTSMTQMIGGGGNYVGNTQINQVFDELAASRGAVEPLLRLRGGALLPAETTYYSGGTQQSAVRIPPVLAMLEGKVGGFAGFPYTMLPLYDGSDLTDPTLEHHSRRTSAWQLVNLADETTAANENDRSLSSLARSLEPYSYDSRNLTPTAPGNLYDRRHQITTTNNSDEVALKQQAGDPANLTDLSKTYEGELKFYLGEINKAFLADTPGPGQYTYDPNRGGAIIRRLARLYNDMLASHDDWGLLADEIPSEPDKAQQGVSQTEQALMLAVNTVAFAAPRDLPTSATPGFIDTVYYTEPTTGRTYVGYAPQPFITEMIAYNNQEDDQDAPSFALAVELYNPSDPYFDTTSVPPVDEFGLDFSQFALSIDSVADDAAHDNDAWPPPTSGLALAPTALSTYLANPTTRIAGRSFYVIPFKDANGNDEFFGSAGGLVNASLTLPSLTDSRIRATLWRYSRVTGGWFAIDQMSTKKPKIILSQGDLPSPWTSAHRDTSPLRFFGSADYDGDLDVRPEYARWGVATGHTKEDESNDNLSGTTTPPSNGSLRNPQWLVKGATEAGSVVDPDPVESGERFSPVTALVTANAAPRNDLWFLGSPSDLRPRSFPTVGFLLLVPRFSHVSEGGGQKFTASQVLWKQWRTQHGTSGASLLGQYPADFGHMPVFDNKQTVKADSYLARFAAGSDPTKEGLPWGLLVFDYFTTLDPTRADVDPYRVPGRINVNEASWYMLSTIPLVGPAEDDASLTSVPYDPMTDFDPAADPANLARRTAILSYDPGANLPISSSIAPSFWDPRLGVLVGRGTPPQNPTDLASAPYRLLGLDGEYVPAQGGPASPLFRQSVPWLADPTTGRWQLGRWLATSLVAHRDGVQAVPFFTANFGMLGPEDRIQAYSTAHLRNGDQARFLNNSPGIQDPNEIAVEYRDRSVFGLIRGRAPVGAWKPTRYGLVSLGELASIKGFDSSRDDSLPTTLSNGASPADTVLGQGDYLKAVSLLVLMDSQYLTTRSNTFTAYVAVTDRQNPAASARSQITFDRSNLLPRLSYRNVQYNVATGRYTYTTDASWPTEVFAADSDNNGDPDTPLRTRNASGKPEIIAQRGGAYFNTRFE